MKERNEWRRRGSDAEEPRSEAEAVADVVGYSYEMRLNHAYYPVAGRIRS